MSKGKEKVTKVDDDELEFLPSLLEEPILSRESL